VVASSRESESLTTSLSESEALAPQKQRLLTRAGFPESTGTRLPGVDGLRAIAAMWVVFFHITAFSHARFGHRFPGLDLFLRSGSTGVSLFLVLSGFCLYIPFAGGRQHRFHVREFLIRRSRRLLPAYYTSLIFVLILNLGSFAWLGFKGLSPLQALWQAVAHALLIHPLFTTTFYELNGAYWSLGLEWQLYLSMPLLIWGICKFGIKLTVATAVGCNILYGLTLGLLINHGLIAGSSLLATIVLPNQLLGRWGEFVFGMVAAELYVTGQIRHVMSRAKLLIPLLIPAFLFAALWPGMHGLVIGAGRHIMYGLVFFCLLCLVLSANNVVASIASWKPLVILGTMSYSLYLVHQPMVQSLAYVLHTNAHTSPQLTFLAVFACIPVIFLLAWILFYTVERRTLQSKRRPNKVEVSPSLAGPAVAATQ
jgi:peptidoglycan/LPS O-acetylase OafA/YrhL